MSRVLRVTVILMMAAVLTLTMTAGSFAGGIKGDQSGSVTVEKGPLFMPGMASPVPPAGSKGPIASFPKWTGQYFNSSEFFFWLNLGYFFR